MTISRLTRRQYMTMRAMMTGCGHSIAAEAVASTALEHPEWDMDGERHTWDEWAAGR